MEVTINLDDVVYEAVLSRAEKQSITPETWIEERITTYVCLPVYRQIVTELRTNGK